MMKALEDYWPFAEAVLKMTVSECDVSIGASGGGAGDGAAPELRDILREHPKLVIALNHSSPLSWIPAPCVLTSLACRAGFGGRVPLGVMDRLFFQLPLARKLAQYITQSMEPWTFEELTAEFGRRASADLIVFPEGSNCFFGPPDGIQEFRSPRFVEFAVRNRVPLLLCVHRGSEFWAKSLPVKPEWLEWAKLLPENLYRRLAKSGVLAVPVPPKKIPRFQMRCELVQPALTPEDLTLDPAANRLLIAAEAERIRSRMKAILAELECAAGPAVAPVATDKEWSAAELSS